jgi:hypothetical protein
LASRIQRLPTQIESRSGTCQKPPIQKYSARAESQSQYPPIHSARRPGRSPDGRSSTGAGGCLGEYWGARALRRSAARRASWDVTSGSVTRPSSIRAAGARSAGIASSSVVGPSTAGPDTRPAGGGGGTVPAVCAVAVKPMANERMSPEVVPCRFIPVIAFAPDNSLTLGRRS